MRRSSSASCRSRSATPRSACSDIRFEPMVKAESLGASSSVVALHVASPHATPRLVQSVRLPVAPAGLLLIAAEASAREAGLDYRIFLVTRSPATDVSDLSRPDQPACRRARLGPARRRRATPIPRRASAVTGPRSMAPSAPIILAEILSGGAPEARGGRRPPPRPRPAPKREARMIFAPVRDLLQRRDGRPILERVVPDVAEGESVSIIGVTGCGTSTSLRLFPAEGRAPAHGPARAVSSSSFTRHFRSCAAREILREGAREHRGDGGPRHAVGPDGWAVGQAGRRATGDAMAGRHRRARLRLARAVRSARSRQDGARARRHGARAGLARR